MSHRAASGGLLPVHAHPDDESLWTGALLATWAAAGRPVTVVTCTRGEQGEVLGPDQHLAGDPAALAAHRVTELGSALAALGVGDHVFLDDAAGETWVDSGMSWDEAGRATVAPEVPAGAFAALDPEVPAARLAQLIVARRPDVVVGYEPGGGYGHPDHVQAHAVMMRAVGVAAASGWQVRCVAWAAVEADELVAGREVCAVDLPPGVHSAVGTTLPSAAVPASAVGLRVDVAPVLDRVLLALRSHVTQVQAVARVPDRAGVLGRYALSGGFAEPVLASEVYLLAPGHRADAVRWPSGVRVA